MTWTATYTGHGYHRSNHATWVDAANWLRAMMEASSPPGIATQMQQLSQATADSPFSTKCDRHAYALGHASAAPTQADLFSGAA